jgi:quinolinate synthase
MNDLESLLHTLETGQNEITVEPHLGQQAMIPLQRMLDFAVRA